MVSKFITINSKYIYLLGIFLLFLLLRLPGAHLLYHQDEYKWPIIVNPALTPEGGIPHPPVGEFIYREAGQLVGYDNFRFIPLIFSTANLFLLFYLVKIIFDKRTALWAIFLFSISFYSVLASLMVDTDGAVMPFFFLLMCIGYYKLKTKEFILNKNNIGWMFLLVSSLVLGFLVKVSFIIPIAAISLDFLFYKKIFADNKKILTYVFISLFLVVVLALLLWISTYVFPSFNIVWSLGYWEHFAVFSGRGWFQTFIQFAKSLLYTSPLLILPVFLVNREIWLKTRSFFFFIFFGLFFYLLAFDFSLGALDRYFQFLVIPLCIIAGAIFSTLSLKDLSFEKNKKYLLPPIVFSVLIFSLQFFTHAVPAQYPKTEWIERVFSLKWNFLFPFSGGSGPTGFYISFAFMALIWIAAVLLTPKKLLTGIFILGLVYNGVFIEEYLFGKINGSPYKLFEDAKEFIARDPDIQQVIVYNDIGGYEIKQTGKYFKRMYATPQFEEEYKKMLGDFDGHLLYIDIPRIYKNSFYEKYLKSCKIINAEQDKYIKAEILDCRKR